MSTDYEANKAGIRRFQDSVFPDLRVTIEDLIAEGDKVVSRNTMTGTHLGDYMG
jgi:predicted ester cyclase